MLNATQSRVLHVLQRLAQMAERNEDDAEMLAQALEPMLRELHNEDAFGTEGQHDPRGDFRDGTWSMDRVQGIDG